MSQVLFKLLAQRVNVYLLIGGKVGAQVVLTVELADNDRDLFDMRLLSHQTFNLA